MCLAWRHPSDPRLFQRHRVAAFYIVQDGLLLLDVPPFVQRALTSVLLLVAVAVGILLRGGRGDRQ